MVIFCTMAFLLKPGRHQPIPTNILPLRNYKKLFIHSVPLENCELLKNHRDNNSMQQLHLTINKKQKDYTITIGNHIVEKIGDFFDLSNYSRIFVITDEHVAPHFLARLLQK